MEKKLKLMVIGAHPDDCDIHAGGLAVKYIRAGHQVLFLSMTNGSAGHQTMGGAKLAMIRYGEAQAVAKASGVTYKMLDFDDAHLEPTLFARQMLVKEIREYGPDIIVTNRPNDYHPDHRATGQLVMDASYMVMVPNFCKLTPPLRYNPIIVYAQDHFRYPAPFRPDVVVDVSDVIEEKIAMMHCHTSQMYDWLRWIDRTLDQVPEGDEARYQYLMSRMRPRYRENAQELRAALTLRYGAQQAAQCMAVEAFEVSEYGGRLVPEQVDLYFPR
jgi:LmbE family N-acetylglucosaminyl deacetylase